MPTSNDNGSSKIDQRVYVEQVSLLYSKSLSRPLLHIISLLVVVSVISNHIDLVYVYLWGVSLIAINIYRTYIIFNTQKILAELTEFKAIHRRFAICAAILGSVYGFGFVCFYKYLPMLNQVYLMMFISVLMPAGFDSFISDRFSFNMFVYPLILPTIIWLFLQEKTDYLYIGICSIIYLMVIFKLFTWNNEALINAIRLRLENEELLISLQLTNDRLMELSVVDELTQIQNRRSFDLTLEKEWFRALRANTTLSMLMIDIDYFKQYNDKFGHIKGDECLSTIANFIKNNLNRSIDFVGRYGGEEFCVIMPDTDISGAINLAEKLRVGIKELEIPNPDSKIGDYITISIGIASVIPDNDYSPMDLIYTSDKALYMAKDGSRDTIRTLGELVKNNESHENI